mmetsp:Transcript_14713/g.22879  ORF Transcript_14713/g.22879 Transcript_14713/m.22879 type:complete len:87 (-) Transcript_14713:53-313(-)
MVLGSIDSGLRQIPVQEGVAGGSRLWDWGIGLKVSSLTSRAWKLQLKDQGQMTRVQYQEPGAWGFELGDWSCLGAKIKALGSRSAA